MEKALGIISFAIIIMAIAIIMVPLFWPKKSKESIPKNLTQIILATILFALHLSELVLQVSLGKSYGMTIFLLCSWSLAIAFLAFLIGVKSEEKSKAISELNIVFHIMDCTNEDNQEESEQENDTN